MVTLDSVRGSHACNSLAGFRQRASSFVTLAFVCFVVMRSCDWSRAANRRLRRMGMNVSLCAKEARVREESSKRTVVLALLEGFDVAPYYVRND